MAPAKSTLPAGWTQDASAPANVSTNGGSIDLGGGVLGAVANINGLEPCGKGGSIQKPAADAALAELVWKFNLLVDVLANGRVLDVIP